MDITKNDFRCTQGERDIYGEILYPDSEPAGVVILSHGFMSCMYDMMNPAQLLVRRGFISVCFDFVGGSRTRLSGGKLSDMTVFTEVEDLKDVVDYVKSRTEFDSLPLYLMGSSQGGLVTALTAAEIWEKVKIEGIILEFPALCIPDDARSGNMVGYRFDPDGIPDLIDPVDGREQMSGSLPREVIGMDVYRDIVAYKGKVLILHGDRDRLVNISYSEKAEKAYTDGKCDCSFVTLHGAGHGFNQAQDEFADDVIAHFMAGYRPFLTSNIELGGTVDKGDTVCISFGGTVEGSGFRGDIVSGIDVQSISRGKVVSSEADYTAVQKNDDGTSAGVHIVNMFDGEKWRPHTIEADSGKISEYNGRHYAEAVEWLEKGPVVHFFVK